MVGLFNPCGVISVAYDRLLMELRHPCKGSKHNILVCIPVFLTVLQTIIVMAHGCLSCAIEVTT